MTFAQGLSREQWRRLSVAIAIPVLLFIFNIPIAEDLWAFSFDDGTYSHAYLIPVVVIYIIYEGVVTGDYTLRPSISWFWLAVFLAILLGYALLFSAQIALGFRVGFIGLILAAYCAVFRLSWSIMMPAIVISFMFPIWGALSPILQELSVISVSFIMSLTHIPAYVEGNFVYIAAGTFEIANGCSGLRYFIVSLLVSFIFTYLNIRSVRHSIIFMSVAILGALIVNWIRITILIVVGHYTDMQSSLMEDHNTLGWYLYLPYLFALLWFGGKFQASDLSRQNNDETIFSKGKLTIAAVPMLAALLISANAISWLAELKQNSMQSVSTMEESWSELRRDALQPNISEDATQQAWQKAFDGQTVTYRQYQFAGTNEFDKASFYDYSGIPEDWQVDSTLSNQQANIQIISEHGRRAHVIAYWYEFAGHTSKQRNGLRKERMMHALDFDRTTRIHWLAVRCQQSCERQQQAITSSITELQN